MHYGISLLLTIVFDIYRFIENSGNIDRINPLKIVEAAWQCNRQIKFAVFSYFQDRSFKMKGTGNFANGKFVAIIVES
jgi:hypothetical protein